ncbi:transposase [Thermodesulfobacteriota bacterium]
MPFTGSSKAPFGGAVSFINFWSKLFKKHNAVKGPKFFVIDDTVLPKRGKHIENVSFVYDHCLGRSVLGYCLVKLGLLSQNGYYPLDFSFWFSSTRHAKSPATVVGDPRSISGQRSFEAANSTKLELALQMLKRAIAYGFNADYVLFDSWYAWPSLISAIRDIKKGPHVICRLKDSKTQFVYQDKKYRLSALYQKVKGQLRKSKCIGLLIKRVTVKMPNDDKPVVIIFAKGYSEPETESIKGKKQKSQPKWVAFLSTDGRLQAATIIKHYTKRWSTEVCFKECKQLMGLGKDHSQNFDAQVFAATISFLRYAVLSYLNEVENTGSKGILFEHLADEAAQITYVQRLWQFFRSLFANSFSKIFELFEIEEEFQPYFYALEQAVVDFMPALGCET